MKLCFRLLFSLVLKPAVMATLTAGGLLSFAGESGPTFIPNQGQWNPEIRFRTPLNGGDVYFASRGILYAFRSGPPLAGHSGGQQARMFGQHLLAQPAASQHNVWVSFVGKTQDPVYNGSHATPEKKHYFLGNDPTHWATDVPVYQQIESNEIWPGIQLTAKAEGEQLKYTWQLAAGAAPQAIRLLYRGADSLRVLPDGSLRVYTPLRTFTEAAPVAWQMQGREKRPVTCRFVLHGDTLAFETGTLNPALPLVIDPTLVFSTFTGSVENNWGYTATYDQADNAYGGGIVFNDAPGSTYVITPGALTATFQGGIIDVGITKFDATGQYVLYSTYIGGGSEEFPMSLVTSQSGELYILGRTNSANFPSLASGYDPSHNGGWDIFVARLSAGGNALLGMTFLGGSGNDGVNITSNALTTNVGVSDIKYNYGDDTRGEIILDNAGNVLIASCTQSADVPVSGGFQLFSGGMQDGLVAKFSPSLSQMLWSGYLGGPDNDAAYSVQVNAANEVYVAGGTHGGINLGTAGHKPVPGGGIEGFLVKISSNGATMHGTYVGTSSYDQAFFVQLDVNGRVYVTGQTESPAYPVLNVGYSEPGGKQFFSVYSADLAQLLRSTTLGPALSAFPNISPTAFLVDNCGNIYLSGWGGQLGSANPNSSGTSNMTLTANALQNQTDGSDFYLTVFSPNFGTLLYATYFGGVGGDHVDGGTSRFDKQGKIYHAVCGGCYGATFPTTSGVWSETEGSPACNLALFKINLGFNTIDAGFSGTDPFGTPAQFSNLCPPALITFSNTSVSQGSPFFAWDFGDGSPGSTLQSPVHQYDNSGTYTVRLIAADTVNCFRIDTAWLSLTVHPKPEITVRPDTAICFGDTLHLITATSDIGGSYQWSPASSLSGWNTPNPVALPGVSTRYEVVYASTFLCRDTASVWVGVEMPPTATLPADTVVCTHFPATISLTTNAVQVQWLPAALFAEPVGLPATTLNLIQEPVQVGAVLLSALGCRDTIFSTLSPFAATFTLESDSICPGETVLLQTPAGITGSYSPASLVEVLSGTQALLHPQQSGIITGYLTSAAGCMDSLQLPYHVYSPVLAAWPPDTAVCRGNGVVMNAQGVGTYSWTPAHSVSDPFAPNPLAAPDTTTLYQVVGINGFGCKDTATVLVEVLPLPVVTASPADTAICAGDTLTLKAAGAWSYQWTPVDSLRPGDCSCTVSANPLQDQAFWVTGTDLFGCEGKASVTVRVIPLPEAMLFGDYARCLGEVSRLWAEGGTSYLWSTGDSTSAIVLPVGPRIDTVWVIPFNEGCAGKPDTLVVDGTIAHPVAAFTVTPEQDFVPFTLQFTNTSQNATTWQWDFDFGGEQWPGNGRFSSEFEPSPMLSYAGTYQIALIASNGACADTAFAFVVGENGRIILPTVFTPNGDGSNQHFLATHYGIASLNVRIFSRWGEKIYESSDLNFRWDGTWQGWHVPEGVYVWVVDAVGMNGMPRRLEGTVLLVR